MAKGLRVGQGASGVAGESYLKRVAEVMRDSLLNEKEAYIQQLTAKLQDDAKIFTQIESVELEYRNIHEENLRLKKQIKEFEAQFEEAIQRLDQRDQHIVEGNTRFEATLREQLEQAQAKDREHQAEHKRAQEQYLAKIQEREEEAQHRSKQHREEQDMQTGLR